MEYSTQNVSMVFSHIKLHLRLHLATLKATSQDDDDAIVILYYLLNLLIYGIMLTIHLLPQQRDPLVYDQRLMWANYVERHTRRNGTFTRRLRMELGSFDKLLEIIREDLEVNQNMANLRGGPIIPDLCLFCTIRPVACWWFLP
jgi:hypothetical protein